MRTWAPKPRPMPDEDYLTLWRLEVSSVEIKGGEVSLSLRAGRDFENVSLPQETWKLGPLDEANFTFPALDSNAVDQPVPIAYGTHVGVQAIVIDTGTPTFRVCGHAVRRFLSIYDGDGNGLAPTSTDLSKGEFTITGWDVQNPVFADFVGLSGNPADLLEDAIETRAGLADVLYKPAEGSSEEGRGFGPYGARSKWIIGTTVSGEEATRPELSIFVRERMKLSDLIKKVKGAAFALTYPAPNGQLVLRKWEPRPSEDALVFRSHEIFEVTRTHEIETVATRVIAKYRKPVDFDKAVAQTVTVSDEAARLIAGLPAHTDFEFEAPLYEAGDAEECASRQLAFRSGVPEIFTITTTSRALLLRPGDGAIFEKTRRVSGGGEVVEIDGYYEVLGVELTVNSERARVTLTNWRGITGEGAAFVTDEGAQFPDYLGGGDLSPWDADWPPEKKRFAAQNGGYVSDANGFIDPDDRDSFKRSVTI